MYRPCIAFKIFNKEEDYMPTLFDGNELLATMWDTSFPGGLNPINTPESVEYTLNEVLVENLDSPEWL